MALTDPRPFVGEPVAVDLLNTLWKADGRRHDLLDSLPGLRTWLDGHGLGDRFPADAPAAEALVRTRSAIAAVFADPRSPAAAKSLDEVLEHGRVRLVLTPEGPGEEAEFADPSWGAAWLAARNYLRLLDTAPDRIRRCAQPDCIRHFVDTSRNGTRRWCSMALCGNRAKVARHYVRNRETRAGTADA
ncbi:CGNR zinc finger domain-containing protein [Streptomyces globisporus]|uniref:CGNR zinc finger domain-containing protein n=1 Tax=Streptomyces globisporus TaxID=1908 RepID=UPI003795D9A2